jgi:hypothetical protein
MEVSQDPAMKVCRTAVITPFSQSGESDNQDTPASSPSSGEQRTPDLFVRS